jgi:hypothetical protein
MPRRLLRGSLAALLAVLAIAVAPAGAQVQDPEAVLDHFLCYTGSSPLTPRSAVLSDQFMSDQTVLLGNADLLCNPVAKTVDGHITPIKFPQAHLICYALEHGPVPPRNVRVTNQFGVGRTVNTGPGITRSRLCVPSLKSELSPPTGSPPEDVLSHFRCHELFTDPFTDVSKPVGVRDQFVDTQIVVNTPSTPVLVCNPATKTVGGVVSPALHPFAHLACYSVSFSPTVNRTAFIRNQFGDATAFFQRPMLCVPSLKDDGSTPPRVAQHFKGFQAVGGPASREQVTLVDQFGTQQVRLGAVRQLFTPVEKRRAGRDPEPIQRGEEHLKCYRISGPAAERTVQVTNQFTASTELIVGQPTDLCAPASKVLAGEPGPPPTDLNHYKCYVVSGGASVAENVELIDQFGTEQVRVQRPSRLCNPVEKRRAGRDPEPPPHPSEHLVCYQMREHGEPFAPRTVFTRDQFGSEALRIDEPSRLCVPSEKTEVGGV